MRVACVVQRCGAEVNGGAEALCLQVAQHLAPHAEIEIFTTCALDYVRWENHYPAGEEKIEGVTIRRFLVDAPRDPETFDQLSAALVAKGAAATLAQQEDWMRAQGPFSSDLLAALRTERENYDAFIFFGYLYATTYFGLPLVADRAWLAPLGHDEWPIHLAMWDDLFEEARAYIFQTHEELAFLRKRFPHLPLTGPVAGIGIEAPMELSPEKFRGAYGLHEPFLLYAGRVEAAKGCTEMFDWFLARDASHGPRYKLVVIGREVHPVPFHDDIIYLGFVSEEEKWNAMAACDWMLLPSQYESLSISLLETWAAGRPSLVNRKSEVLLGHCQRSNGGLWYDSWPECEAIIRAVDDNAKTVLGRQGREYVLARYNWVRVEKEYLGALAPARSDQTFASPSRNA